MLETFETREECSEMKEEYFGMKDCTSEGTLWQVGEDGIWLESEGVDGVVVMCETEFGDKDICRLEDDFEVGTEDGGDDWDLIMGGGVDEGGDEGEGSCEGGDGGEGEGLCEGGDGDEGEGLCEGKGEGKDKGGAGIWSKGGGGGGGKGVDRGKGGEEDEGTTRAEVEGESILDCWVVNIGWTSALVTFGGTGPKWPEGRKLVDTTVELPL